MITVEVKEYKDLETLNRDVLEGFKVFSDTEEFTLKLDDTNYRNLMTDLMYASNPEWLNNPVVFDIKIFKNIYVERL